MDLTGRFTGKLGGETDFNSVRNAIESVDAFFSSVLRKEAEEEECLQFFFKDEKAAQPNEHYFDILENNRALCMELGWRRFKGFLDYPRYERG